MRGSAAVRGPARVESIMPRAGCYAGVKRTYLDGCHSTTPQGFLCT